MIKDRLKENYSKPANTFIDKGVVIEAKKLSGSESVRVDGHFIGDINLDGYLQIGETGIVEGDLKVSYALIAGTVYGNITCRATVQLAHTAKIQGNILCKNVIIDEGAVFYGYCQMENQNPEVVVV